LDIDVLFYGSLNDRRREVLQGIERAGLAAGKRNLRVVHAYGAYGASRDALVSRAKIVLNLHFYEAKVFEVVRVSQLLANGRFVISEGGTKAPGDTEHDDGGIFRGLSDHLELEEDERTFAGGLVFARYADLVRTALYWLQPQHAHERQEIARKGLEIMRGRHQAVLLRNALSSG
jgi:hypothetical protein